MKLTLAAMHSNVCHEVREIAMPSAAIPCRKSEGRGRAADCSAALLQTRASAINAHGSSDHGFAGSFVAMDDFGRDQRVVDE